LEAEITLEYDDARTAEAVCKAVSPDNFKTPNSLSIETRREKKKVITHIKHDGKLGTFIATIDDLLFCVSAAERMIRATRNLNDSH
jgi:tRNA threonylcarbamoyladenosine modification (KEOPS) complex  Pcc1 subunit